ncbi:MAG TPA: hypothetical protein ENI76_06360 [Ignavibacteria bacterium]|nr:hypothetical protein [Ignavibacteria bacterium]
MAKLGKTIDGTTITLSVDMGEGRDPVERMFDSEDLPDAIQQHLIMAAIGRAFDQAVGGKEIINDQVVDIVDKKWAGFKEGNWTTRTPGKGKVSKKSIIEKLQAMPEGEAKERVKASLIEVGIEL